jgi:hypothetical protein
LPLIIRPEEATKPEFIAFDVLMHTHHVVIDGSRIQSIFNEFLARWPILWSRTKWFGVKRLTDFCRYPYFWRRRKSRGPRTRDGKPQEN